MISPFSIRNSISGEMARALHRGFGLENAGIRVGESAEPSFGDLSCSAAMGLARTLRRPPAEIAAVMAREVSQLPFVDSVSVDGPGFVNITLSMDYLASAAARLSQSGLRALLSEAGARGNALVEFVSSNPTGPLTVGHCRQAVLGEAICRLLSSVGWTVTREYYFNDAGRQMDRLAESLAARYCQFLGGAMTIPEGGYQGEYVLDWARSLVKTAPALEWPRDRNRFREEAVNRAFELIRDDLSLLGITFDRYFAESELIPDQVEKTMARLEKAGLTYRDPDGSGKVWLSLTALGRPEDRVVRRAEGGYTYRMPDIAYHLDKFDRGYDLMVDVFGSDHIDTSRDVEAAVSALLGKQEVENRLKTVIHQFVTLARGGEIVKMSTRAGDFVTLRDLVSEVGSPDVTRYLFLTRRAEAHMEFDLEAARKDSEENPVYYIQYAFARIGGILRLAGDRFRNADPAEDAQLLVAHRERELLRLLEALPVRVADAASDLAPHRITETASELATAFHGFYQHHKVIDEGNIPLTRARMLLCLACREGLFGLLEVLGVSAPERM
jgi:arginyl-tRNA synthetase